MKQSLLSYNSCLIIGNHTFVGIKTMPLHPSDSLSYIIKPQGAFSKHKVALLYSDLPLRYAAAPIALLSFTLGSAAPSHSPSLKSYSAMSFSTLQWKAFP